MTKATKTQGSTNVEAWRWKWQYKRKGTGCAGGGGRGCRVGVPGRGNSNWFGYEFASCWVHCALLGEDRKWNHEMVNTINIWYRAKRSVPKLSKYDASLRLWLMTYLTENCEKYGNDCKKKRGTSDKLNKLTMIEKRKREMQFELWVGLKMWMKSFLMNGREHKTAKYNRIQNLARHCVQLEKSANSLV